MNAHVPSRALAFLAQLLLLTACGDSSTTTPPEIDKAMLAPVQQNQITAAAGKRVIFAHQSVGSDILDGANLVAASAGVPLNVIEPTFTAPVFGSRRWIEFSPKLLSQT